MHIIWSSFQSEVLLAFVEPHLRYGITSGGLMQQYLFSLVFVIQKKGSQTRVQGETEGFL